jgi:hypothetical protein
MVLESRRRLGRRGIDAAGGGVHAGGTGASGAFGATTRPLFAIAFAFLGGALARWP